MKSKFLHFVVTIVTLLSVPSIIFAQAPGLGTAANFVLFTASGAVTNTGTSQLTGNVGTNTGAITGFGNVNGQMHTSDGATASAAADLITAYNKLDTTTSTASHAPQLGNGESLDAGVYFISGNSTLDNKLTLNGNGNAVFIIKIQGTFSTTNKSEVVLTGGAVACNVFWKIEGAVSLATASVMKGNVIANNAAIAIANGVSLEGRALSTTGAITLNGTTAKTPVGCGSPLLTGPAAPALGTTVCYALFSGNGQVTNAGNTFVTGDIGTNSGLVAGFNPLNVTGTIHTIPDGSTSMCAADLLNLYGSLNTAAADINLLFPAQFGRGLTLTPHTYTLNGATAFNDTVFLNAQGNADAVFIIKINGAFQTGTYSVVSLMNGTQAKNVFWKVEGAVNIDNYSNFAGTIVANNGAVSLGTGTVLNGRAFTTTGALSTASINAVIPSGCSSLPLTWLYFRGNAVKEDALLEWGTSNEIENGFFTIEKSIDGVKFETLTTVTAAKDAGTADINYAYTDRQPSGLNYYRLSQTDRNGKRSYYRTVQVKMNANQNFKATTYTRGDKLYVQTSGANAANGSLELVSIEGKKISSQKIVLSKEVTTYKIQKPSQTGVYIITIQSEGAKIFNGKVMVF
ncbi:MAG TPA: ice-binding family protein [Segetibacter sp.]